MTTDQDALLHDYQCAAEPDYSYATMMDWIRRYPEHADAIAALTVGAALLDRLPPIIVPAHDRDALIAFGRRFVADRLRTTSRRGGE